MADAPTREPNGPAKRPESPALASRGKCPTCGRGRAIVFRQIREYVESVKGAPLVCPGCCPEAHGRP
jgi:hypothetical protein